MTLIALLQEVSRPSWYDWPWGAVGAISIIVTGLLLLLRLLLRDQFTSPKQFDDLKKQLEKEHAELKAQFDSDLGDLADELKGYEGRCNDRTTKFEERLEKGFATVHMLNGVGERVAAVDKKIDGTMTLFTQTRDRADQAHEIARDLKKDLEYFMGRMEEKLQPVTEFRREIASMNERLTELTRVLDKLQASIPNNRGLIG